MYLDATPTQRGTETLFSQVSLECIFERKMDQFYQDIGFFPVEEHRVCAQHFNGATK